MTRRLADEGAIFLLAVQFLTRLPLPIGPAYSPARMASTPRWLPAVGALIGTFAAAVFWFAASVFPPALAALLSTVATLLLTGALHEDGFADTCDGLGARASRERALEIMRDSRLGTWGAAGLGLILGAKILSLAALPPDTTPIVLIAGHAASRASAVLVIATSNYVRDEGTGKPVAAGVCSGGLAVALATGALAVAATAWVLPFAAVAGGIGGLILGHGVMRLAFERRLGGYTGDCLGAVQQTSETCLYLGVLACL